MKQNEGTAWLPVIENELRKNPPHEDAIIILEEVEMLVCKMANLKTGKLDHVQDFWFKKPARILRSSYSTKGGQSV